VYIGEQLNDFSDKKLTWAAQMGVEHIAANNAASAGVENPDGTLDVAKIKAFQKRLAEYGITVDVLTLDLQSSFMSGHRHPGIMRGLPSRDAEIEIVKQNIRAAGEAGIPCMKYNLNLLGVPRTGRVPGRGSAMYSHFNYDEWTDHSLTDAGPMPEEKMWDVIGYFVERVAPVAEECGVRLACHPHDPAVPPSGLRGICRVLGTVDGLKKFVSLYPSKYHGLNFCVGTVAEMLKEPGKEIFDVVRHFGEQGKIFMVHYRNITGGYLNFDEVYPDNGDMDFYKLMKLFKQIGYVGMFLPDHVPQSSIDPDNEKQHSFCLGYIRAMIQAVNSEA